MTDITKIPKHELEKDLQDSRNDAGICKLALRAGIKTYSGGSVSSRMETNERIVEVIAAELKRRADRNKKCSDQQTINQV